MRQAFPKEHPLAGDVQPCRKGDRREKGAEGNRGDGKIRVGMNDMFQATGRPPVAGAREGRYVFFPSPEHVPQEFRISAASSAPGAPWS